MYSSYKSRFATELASIREAGFYKEERILQTQQQPQIRVKDREVINFCANNYLGLANNPQLIEAAQAALHRWGLGVASVRFICGTQEIHKELESKVSEFHGTEDTILYTSCWDANGGLFETILGEQDAIISATLNHASIIDGIRLCKAARHRYPHDDLSVLEQCLQDTQGARMRLIATDGVFSMDGDVADLRGVCDLAEKYNALVMVDESHASGFFGPTGRGSVEHCGVSGRVDIITSTFGKALGGSTGGFTTGPKEIIDLLRQRSRTYLFSNSMPPAIVAASLAALGMLSETTELRDRLEKNTHYFRAKITEAGFQIRPGVHPVVPIMLGEARTATEMARRLLDEGIYVIGFSFPVVPKGAARIRVQISAAHTQSHLDQAVKAFTKIGRELGVLN